MWLCRCEEPSNTRSESNLTLINEVQMKNKRVHTPFIGFKATLKPKKISHSNSEINKDESAEGVG